MLSGYAPIPTLGVSDLARAREYYEGVLGFTARDVLGEDAVLYDAGPGGFLVYVSAYAGTNKATSMSFSVPVEEFDAEIAALREKGVAFQTYELDGTTWDDGVATFDGARAVWFEDPDGNILNVEATAG